jgi:hypothetical protein
VEALCARCGHGVPARNSAAALLTDQQIEVTMRSCISRRSVRHALPVVVFSAIALTACSDSLGPGGAAPEAAINFQRLVVADAEAATARVVALNTDQVVQTFNLTEPSQRVYRSHGGRYVVVHQRTANRVHFVDAGVWTHDNDGHRENPVLSPFMLNDGAPTHENVNGDWISVFFDGSGIARWVRESELRAGSPRVAFEVNTGAAHHGGSFTITPGGQPFFAYSTPNPAGGLPIGVAVRNAQGQVVSQLGNCPGLHGNSAIADAGVFGCNDGLVIVRGSGGSAVAEKVTTSGDMAGLALRNAYATSGVSYVLGQFAAFPGQPTQRVLATIQPATGAISRLPALPAGVVDHWRVIEPGKERIVILGNNGTVFVYSASRQLVHTIPGVVPALPASGPLTHQVSAVEDMAAVASPYTGEVVLLNLNSGAVIRRINLGGRPSRLEIAGALRAGQYRLHGH